MAARTKTADREREANLKILRKVEEGGDLGVLFPHTGQWKRAEDLVDKKLLRRKMVVARAVQTRTTLRTDERPAFWLTDEGREYIKKEGL